MHVKNEFVSVKGVINIVHIPNRDQGTTYNIQQQIVILKTKR